MCRLSRNSGALISWTPQGRRPVSGLLYLSGCTISFTPSHKRHDFLNKLLNIKCVLWFPVQILSATFLILRIQRDIITDVNKSSCKVPVILARFSSNVHFLNRGSKNPQIKNSMSFRPVGAELFPAAHVRTVRRTDRYKEANSRFSQFCESAHKYSVTTNECYKEQFLSIKSRCYNENRWYKERGGILSVDVARACAWRVGPSRFD
jgi:hypothetical protein